MIRALVLFVWILGILTLVWYIANAIIASLESPTMKFRITRLKGDRYIIENKTKSGRWEELYHKNTIWTWRGNSTGIHYNGGYGYDTPHEAKAKLSEMIEWIRTHDEDVQKKNKEVIKAYDFE